MHKRTLLNVILALGVLALAAVAWFEPGRTPAEEGFTLPVPAKDTIERLRLTRDGVTVVLERAGGSWHMREPYALPADDHQIGLLLDSLAQTSKARYAVRDLDLARYGLAAPRMTLAANDVELAFGETEPLSYRRYVRLGEFVYLVDDLLHYRLDQEPAHFVSKKLLPEGAKPVAIALPGRTLKQGADGKWTLVPEDTAVGADAINQLVDAWRTARAFEVKPLGEAPSQGEVSITLESVAEPIRFAILTDADALVLARRDLGLQYEFFTSERARLFELKPASASETARKATP
ncbi:MAG TPA: DUF4340 domain-containing protein [Gammaproteobacteria bacterium]|nr:DUF4340 domain-containing protein [Gammaproteobacteria bacterium]